MASVPQNQLTPEDYLERERKAEFKSEYFNGETFAVAGASLSHAQLIWNLSKELSGKLDAECRAFISDLRLEGSFTGLFTYPERRQKKVPAIRIHAVDGPHDGAANGRRGGQKIGLERSQRNLKERAEKGED